jgi:hypothetical protein
MWMDAVIHNLWHYNSISQEELRKTTKKSQSEKVVSKTTFKLGTSKIQVRSATT